MSSSSEEFEKLQKLLSVKRHEQPPPLFFVDFSEKVLHRLDSPETVEPATWWQRMGLDFDFKPAFVCAWGVALCGSLVVAIIASVHMREPIITAQAPPSELAPLRIGMPALVSGGPRLDQPVGSTEPVISLAPSPLSQFSLVGFGN